MREEALKTELQKRRPISEWVWTKLEADCYVEDALLKDTLEEAVEFLVTTFDELIGTPPGRRVWERRGGDRGADTIDVALNDLELERQAALETYLAMCAECDLDVYRFRKEVLEGRLLAVNRARELLRSPAAAFLETKHFKMWNIPVTGHSAKVKYESELVPPGFERHTATITLHPPGITRKVELPTWPGYTRGEKQRIVVLEFPDEQGKVVGHEVWSNSLLGELRQVGEKLSERYRWQAVQAVWFVLTGAVPAVPALTVTRTFPSSIYHQDTLITIEAAPWVSSERVEKAFRSAQIKTMGTKGNRRPSKKNLRLFRFVNERIEPLGLFEEGKRPAEAPEGLVELELVTNLYYMRIPEHRDLVREWNEKYPEDSYGTGTSRFWRDYKRMMNTIAPFGPPYHL
jgi:hypothetical protein